ncbi:MAG: helix-turn-helix domain-containing protein [Verrucomicrobia bacterium]|nr:helix-turn-helix domain-containing protein [Verrucomicrobiota bacterium]
MNRAADLIQRISKSDIYKDYERAFSDATQLPVALRPTEIWRLALEGKRYQNPFCALLAKTNRTCAACLQVQKEMQDMPGSGAKTVTCFAGLCDSAVPVNAGEKVVGYLQTGQVALRKPNEVQFNRITQQLVEWGVNVDLAQLKDAYYRSRTLAPQQYTAMVKLLEIFASHISRLANEIVVQEDEAESPMIRRPRAYILANQADPIDLDKVAQAMHVSTFYFCKMFKKATGLTFTDYLSRVRVEKAKKLLLNPHLRISEIAYDVGFQSLTHFNRMFRKIVGESPTAYREAKSVRQLLN